MPVFTSAGIVRFDAADGKRFSLLVRRALDGNARAQVRRVLISGDGGRIAFSSNRGGFSFQSPLDVNSAPVAMKPTGLAPFTGDFSENPTQSEMRAFRDWANAFFGASAR
ncbi:MAG: hypothetical protein HZC54_03185 [Verrucomicrobia bacterium]|nr:hypothetical protein [Verrucomicrobiota bacterium]